MKFDGDFIVEGTPEEVWPYFNDPAILEDCAPGCKELSLVSSSEIRADLEVGVGSVKPAFEVNGVVTECDEPNRLAITASGEASRNSFSVTAWQELQDNGDGTTTVYWEATAEISGVIASLGERAIGSVTTKLVEEFFQDIEDHINAGTDATAQLAAADAETAEAAQQQAEAAAAGGTVTDLVATARESDIAPYAGGALLGLVALFVLTRLTGSSDSVSVETVPARGEGTDGSPPIQVRVEPGSSGGRLRSLAVGALLGIVAKGLYDAYAAQDAAAESDEGGEVDSLPATETATDETGRTDESAGQVGSATSATNGHQSASDDPEHRLIENPLDRLN